jgi:hypothetical protein
MIFPRVRAIVCSLSASGVDPHWQRRLPSTSSSDAVGLIVDPFVMDAEAYYIAYPDVWGICSRGVGGVSGVFVLFWLFPSFLSFHFTSLRSPLHFPYLPFTNAP